MCAISLTLEVFVMNIKELSDSLNIYGSTSFLLSFFVCFVLFRLFLPQIMSSVEDKHPFLQANTCMLIDLSALAHRSDSAIPYDNIRISLFRGRSLLNMILFHFMVKIRTFL